jgi:hypothetical protein
MRQMTENGAMLIETEDCVQKALQLVYQFDEIAGRAE